MSSDTATSPPTIGSALADLSVGDGVFHAGRWYQIEIVDHATLYPVGLGPRPICHFCAADPVTGFTYSDTATDGWRADRFVMRSVRRAA